MILKNNYKTHFNKVDTATMKVILV